MPHSRSNPKILRFVSHQKNNNCSENDWRESFSKKNEQVSESNSLSSFSGFEVVNRSCDGNSDLASRRKMTLDDFPLDMVDDAGSNSFSSSSSDLMSSSVIEGKCCEEHLSLTREMAIKLLQEYVKNLKDFSSMMRERQSTTVRDISTSPIHSPSLDDSDKLNCVRKRDHHNSDNSVGRQRPSSILGIGDLNHNTFITNQNFRTETPTNVLSPSDTVIDIPLSSTKKHFFPTSQVFKVVNHLEKPITSTLIKTDKAHPIVIAKEPCFMKNSVDSDDSGQRTPVNSEPNMPNTVLRSEKHYQLEKDPGNSMPILSATQPFLHTTVNNEFLENCGQEIRKQPERITSLPPQPEIMRSERSQKPNILILDEKSDQESIISERQSMGTLRSPPHPFHMRTSSDISKMERLRRKSPSPSYTSSNIFENSVQSNPVKPGFHSSPTSQPKMYHSATLRSSSVQRMPSNPPKETPWYSHSSDVQPQNSNRSLVKSSSSIPLSGNPSYLDSISSNVLSPPSQVVYHCRPSDHLVTDSKQTLREEVFKPSLNGNKSIMKEPKQSVNWSNVPRFQKNDESIDSKTSSFSSNSQHTTTHVTEINRQQRWSFSSKVPVNTSLNVEHNGFSDHNNQSSVKSYTESAIQSPSTSNEYSFVNEINRFENTDEISNLNNGIRTRSVSEQPPLSPNRFPNRFVFRSNSDQISPPIHHQAYQSAKQSDVTQYNRDNSLPNKFDTSTQTDDFYSKSWTTGSLDSPNNQDSDASCEFESPNSTNEPKLQTWPLSLQSIVRPTDSDSNSSIPPKPIENNRISNVNMHIQKSKPSCTLIPTKANECKIQSGAVYQKEPWRRHSLRINPTDVSTQSTSLQVTDNLNDKPPQRLSSSRKPRTASRFSIGNPSELETPRCRSVHFSSDVLVAHTGSGPEPLLLSSAPLKEPASDDEDSQSSYFIDRKPNNHLTKLSIDCGQNASNIPRSFNSRTKISKPTAPLPFRRQFVFNSPNNLDF
ncbi:unnamed protein product [Trichobilharzia szidati]|nr:unnamed protein product [Trichobilharzia szidati]